MKWNLPRTGTKGTGLQQAFNRAEEPGDFATEKAVKTGKAALVIVAGDASENTKKMFTNMCAFYEVPVYFYSDKETLGHAIGKQFRASLAVVDEGFRNTIEKHLKNGLEQQM